MVKRLGSHSQEQGPQIERGQKGGVFPEKILLDFPRKAILRMVTEADTWAVRGSYTFQELGFLSEEKMPEST